MNEDKCKLILNISGGWITVAITHQDFNLLFDSSMVPGNPIEELITSLNLVLQCTDSEVCWNLEPGNYYFKFARTQDRYSLSILFSDGKSKHREPTYSIESEFEALILPFYRAIKQFFTLDPVVTHWSEDSKKKVNKLTQLIQEKKDHKTKNV